MVSYCSAYINNVIIQANVDNRIANNSAFPIDIIKVVPVCVLYYFCIFRGDKATLELFVANRTPAAIPWQYFYCKNTNDDPSMMIKALASHTHYRAAEWLYYFCVDTDDREEVWRALSKIIHPKAAQWQYWYCRFVKDREEIWRALAKTAELSEDKEETFEWRKLYCKYIKHRPEMKIDKEDIDTYDL